MGFFWKGKAISDFTLLEHLLGKDITPIASWENPSLANYQVENLANILNLELFPRKIRKIVARIWIWTNLKTDDCIVAGDEGNHWCVELLKGKRSTILQELVKCNPSSRYPLFLRRKILWKARRHRKK